MTKVQRKADGKAYAMKRISLRQRGRRELKDALNEALLLARLRHPNIVRYHEVGHQAVPASYVRGDGTPTLTPPQPSATRRA